MADHDQNDGKLLAEFLDAGGEAAFEKLIQRHGRMVFNVCHRVLGQTQDAEDAAQAVFLTLAQKARALTHRESLAGWLHHVAWHVAQRARESRSLQRHREREAGEMKDNLQQRDETAARQWRELAPLLDEELDALPEKYRLPLILHHMEGHTKDETARMLATNAGTISTWLDRGREKLKDRLARRGVVLSAGLIATLASQNASAVELSVTFAASTAKAATLVTFGNAAATGAVSAHVAALTEGMMKTLLMAKLKAAAAIVTAVMLAGGGAGVITYTALAEDAPAPGPNGAAPQVTPAGEAKPELPETQAAALERARKADIPALLNADSAVIAMGFVETARTKAAIIDAESLKKIVGMLTVADTVPSGGEAEFNVSFKAKGAVLNEVWVYPDGEWGIVRRGGTSWTLGRNAALPKLLRELSKGAAATAEGVDEGRMKRAELVLRVKKIRSLGADKYGSDEVRVLKVLKNEANASVDEVMQIFYLSTQTGVPDAECTVYLERYNPARNDLWKLLGGGARDGVSHEGAPEAPKGYTYVARIVKIAGTTLTLHSFRGHSGIIKDEETDAQTAFEPNGKPGKITDFKKDDWVKITWTDNPKRILKVETTKGLWEDAAKP